MNRGSELNRIRYQPVLDNPTDWDIIKNIRPGALLLTLAWTAAGGVAGYAYGKPFRHVGMWAGAGACLVGGLMSNFVRSQARLLGYIQNDKELEKYGIQKKQLVEVIRKRDIRPREELFK